MLNGTHDVVPLSSRSVDITDPKAVREITSRVKPDILLNCAAYTQVDECEKKRDLAWKVNVEGPGNLAAGAKETGARLIHISTDYVFDGKKEVPEPNREDDQPHPLSFYGKTKLKGEEVIRETLSEHAILRTSWLYGLYGHNFLKTMLRLALDDPLREIKVVNDQFGSPTWSLDLAGQVGKIIETGGQGTYHATAEGYCTWYELATFFLERMGVPHSIIPCATTEFPTAAVRPKNSILGNQRLKKEGIYIMRPWKEGVGEFTAANKARLMKEVGR